MDEEDKDDENFPTTAEELFKMASSTHGLTNRIKSVSFQQKTQIPSGESEDVASETWMLTQFEIKFYRETKDAPSKRNEEDRQSGGDE